MRRLFHWRAVKAKQEGEGDGRLQVKESGEERGEVFGCGDGGEGDDGAVVEPVGPTHGEACGGAKGSARVDVEAAGLGHGGS